MNQQQKETIRDLMFHRMKSRGISSYNKLATDIGISNAIITYIDKGEFEKISDTMWQKIGTWSGYYDVRQPALTTNFKRILNACRHVKTKGLCRGIAKDSGIGKTFPLKWFKNNNENVFYVECDGFMTKKGFVLALAAECKLEISLPASIGEILQAIFDHINSLTKPLIIIDEADELKEKLPTFIKTFYNKCNTGIFISGGNTLRKQFEKGTKTAKQSYQEGFSRMGGDWVSLNQLTAEDVKLMCVANGVPDDMSVITDCIAKAKGDCRNVDAWIETYHETNAKGGVSNAA